MAINLRHFRPRAAARKPQLDLLQTQCWEDEDLVIKHLGGPGRVGAVIEGADSVLALALSGAEVVAWGSPGEQALLELKLVGTSLRHPEYLQLLGLLEAGRRLMLYHQIRSDLSAQTRGYWDQHEATVRVGILPQGRFEKGLTRLRERVLPVAMGGRMDRLLAVQSMEEQTEILGELKASRRWRAVDHLAERGLREGVERALSQRLVHDCGPLLWLFLGYFPKLEGCGRRYLLPENYEAMGKLAERIQIQAHPAKLARLHMGHRAGGSDAETVLSWGQGRSAGHVQELGGISLRGAGSLRSPPGVG
ncbi:MAG: S-adenosylmethionine:diacylglycerol 3-amino-3-carboxypropyl transferase [Cognaticolwellia sp.]